MQRPAQSQSFGNDIRVVATPASRSDVCRKVQVGTRCIEEEFNGAEPERIVEAKPAESHPGPR